MCSSVYVPVYVLVHCGICICVHTSFELVMSTCAILSIPKHRKHCWGEHCSDKEAPPDAAQGT